MNINRPGWGFNGGNRPWGDHWYDNHVNWHNHGWYHGCWGGWGNNWYTPLVYGSVGWGLGALSSGWGYGSGYTYANPYYSTADSYYDYSQPVSVANYAPAPEPTDTVAAAAPPAETDAQTAAYAKVEEALASFRAGQYADASAKIRQAIGEAPDDPALHEFAALCDFALGQYQSAAAALNSVLAVAPGMDWTSLSGLYGNIDDYHQQLAKLRDFTRSNPQDAAAQFVLAYQDLVSGDTEEATAALRAVVAAKPQDMVAKRMLDGLTKAAETSATAAAPVENPAGTRTPPPPTPTEPAGPTTDLVGSWTAERDGAKFSLQINEDGTYTWSATPAGKPAVELQGAYAINGTQLVLESEKQGNLAAEVASKDADHFSFIPADSPPGDAGLLFTRSK